MISSTKSSIESFIYSPRFQTSRDFLLIGATITTLALSIIFAEPLALGAAAIPLAMYLYSRYKRISRQLQSQQQNQLRPIQSLIHPPRQNSVPPDEINPRYNLPNPNSHSSTAPQPQSVLKNELDIHEPNPYESAILLGEECLKNEIFLEDNISPNCQSLDNNLRKICEMFHLEAEDMLGGFVIINSQENNPFNNVKQIKSDLFKCFLALKNIEICSINKNMDDMVDGKNQLFESIQDLLGTMREANSSSNSQAVQKPNVIQSPEIVQYYETAAILIETCLKIDFSKNYTTDEWLDLEKRLKEEIGGLFGLRFYLEIQNKYSEELDADIPTYTIESIRNETSDNFEGIAIIESWLKTCLLTLHFIKNPDDEQVLISQKNNLLLCLQKLKEALYASCPAISQEE